MLLVLALRSDPKSGYERALRQFSVQEISEAFAATRGLTMPSQLRRMLRAQGRDLHAEFLQLLPEPPRPVAIQRFTPRRIGLTFVLVAAVILVALAVNLNLRPLGYGSPRATCVTIAPFCHAALSAAFPVGCIDLAGGALAGSCRVRKRGCVWGARTKACRL